MRLFCKKETDIAKLAKAEAEMMEWAKKFGDRDEGSFEIVAQDTVIPREALPLKKNQSLKNDLHMHHVKVTTTTTSKKEQEQRDGNDANEGKDGEEDDDNNNNNNNNSTPKEKIPIVILHGYMNGALYFYRNIVSLSNHFETVYSVDTLGMGLSSREPGLLKKKVGRSVEETEAFFVEALEAWRKANGIDQMILAGHSIGGYIGVPYAERYPQRVSHLLLLTPVGLTRENPEEITEMLNSMSWTQRQTASLIRYFFDCGVTPASFLRKIPRTRAKRMVAKYVQRRLPVIEDVQEQQAVADYLYYLAMVPGFGENMLNRFLRSSSHGIKPTMDRIPHLQVPKVSIIYGESDWMDIEGGVEACENARSLNDKAEVDVYQLQDAGHLMMLDNWRGFYSGIVTMCGETRLPPNYPKPTLVRTTRTTSIVLSIDISLEERLDKVAQATTF